MRIFFFIVAFFGFSCLTANAQQPNQGSVPSTQTGASEKLVRLYPNPAISYVTFELKASEQRKGYTVQVYNGILGKKVYESRFPGDRFTLNLNEFSRGLYIYHMLDATGKVIESGKFQVSK